MERFVQEPNITSILTWYAHLWDLLQSSVFSFHQSSSVNQPTCTSQSQQQTGLFIIHLRSDAHKTYLLTSLDSWTFMLISILLKLPVLSSSVADVYWRYVYHCNHLSLLLLHVPLPVSWPVQRHSQARRRSAAGFCYIAHSTLRCNLNVSLLIKRKSHISPYCPDERYSGQNPFGNWMVLLPSTFINLLRISSNEGNM